MDKVDSIVVIYIFNVQEYKDMSVVVRGRRNMIIESVSFFVVKRFKKLRGRVAEIL